MKLEKLLPLFREMVCKLEELDGYLFVDRLNEGAASLRQRKNKYAMPSEAQCWMNTVLIDLLITDIVGDEWDLTDPAVGELLSIFEIMWSCQVHAKYPNARFKINKIIDAEYGDVGLQLLSFPDEFNYEVHHG